MFIMTTIFDLIWYLVVVPIVAVIVLMLIRLILGYADLNPFSRPVIIVRRITDPLVNPVRRALVGFGIEAKFAPLITILLTILVGYFALLLASSLLNTVTGILVAAGVIQNRPPIDPSAVAVLGYILYGLLSFYSLLIFIRIIFSWGMVSHSNPVMHFLVLTTDSLLVPLRRMIPPLAMFDLSPIVAFIIIWLFQAAVYGTLLRGWPLQFVG